MVNVGELWGTLGSIIASVMVLSTVFKEHLPYGLWGYVEKYGKKLMRFVYPYIEITFDEFSGERLKRSEVFSAIQNYLSSNASKHASRFKADVVKDSQALVLSMEDREEITDEFMGVRVWWELGKNFPKREMSFSFYPAADEKRHYKLTFHKRDRELITESYIKHVLKEGKATTVKNRQRKLFSNNPSNNWYGWKQTKWSHVYFDHPATFDTLAMETKKKEEIKNDLKKFSESKEYYLKIGKAWKRGYLLYGPPGTGKSTMIAAMANFLSYDVYDLELTTVKDNSELRTLLIETSGKSIIVIEDIDCSLDLTGQREKKKEKDGDEEKNPIEKKAEEENDSKKSKVTLSGLLNFIDGLWSACGGERIIVFTTNYVEKLDPALIRRGRMDKHIEMSYCCFEAFKVLTKNYLDIESHELFPEIENLLGETNMTPADVAENVMPKCDEADAETCLKNLIEALKEAKEEARMKAEEEARLKAEEEKRKAEEEERSKEEKDEKEKHAENNVKNDETCSNSLKENGFADNEGKGKES